MPDRAVFALTEQGAALASRIATGQPAELHLPASLAPAFGAAGFQSLAEATTRAYDASTGLVYVAAAGIVVRLLAPHLRGKDRDPAVVVLDQAGRFAVSLLSGHLGGANDLAREVARLVGAQPVISTATDTAGVQAVDLLALRRNMAIENPGGLSRVNMAVLESRPIQVLDPEDRLGLAADPPEGLRLERLQDPEDRDPQKPALFVSWRLAPALDPDRWLLLRPKVLAVGVGCHRGTPASEILELIREVFRSRRLSLQSVSCLCTAAARGKEPGLWEAAARLGVQVASYGGEALGRIRVPHPSATVKDYLGVDSVCEAAALHQANGGRLLAGKTKGPRATVAVALEA